MTFLVATSVDEALAAMADGAQPIAGGSDLVVGARHGKAPLPASLVAIDRLADLDFVELSPAGELVIGALATHATLESHPAVVAGFSALADASALVGSPATRNVGTLGGNVMNASPAMDTGAPLVVFGATVQLRSLNGVRTVPVGELWTGPGRTSAASGELAVSVTLRPRPTESGSAYVRLEYRRAMEIAVVGAAASVTIAADGSIASATVALTAVAPTIIAVQGLDGAVTLEQVAAAASEQAVPISDVRASESYRRHCVGVMAKRAVDAAARRARGESIAVPVNRSLGIGAAR